MKTVNFDGRRGIPRAVCVGVEMDNNAEQVKFDLPRIVEGQIETLYWKTGEDADAILLDNGVWTITNTITQYPGEAECYIAISNGNDILWHSREFYVKIHELPDVEGEIIRIYPTAIQAAVDAAAQAIAAKDVAVSAKESAQAAQAEADAASIDAQGAAVLATGAAAGAAESAETAKRYARLAEMSAETHGFFNVFIDERGHLIYERTDSIDDVNILLENGRLIVEYPVEGVVTYGG